MPSMRLLLVHFFPRIMGSTGARYYYNSNGNSNTNGANSRGLHPSRGGNSRTQRSIQLVSTTSGHHHKGGMTNTTITTINANDEEDDIGTLPPQERHRRNILHGKGSGGNGATTAQGSPPDGTMRHGHGDSVGGLPVHPDMGGIVYSKSYAVEYNTDYNDEARLVYERDQRLHSISKSDQKSSRGSESSL